MSASPPGWKPTPRDFPRSTRPGVKAREIARNAPPTTRNASQRFGSAPERTRLASRCTPWRPTSLASGRIRVPIARPSSRPHRTSGAGPSVAGRLGILRDAPGGRISNTIGRRPTRSMHTRWPGGPRRNGPVATPRPGSSSAHARRAGVSAQRWRVATREVPEGGHRARRARPKTLRTS